MLGNGGRAWLAAVILSVSLVCAAMPAQAAEAWGGPLPFRLAGSQTPMAAQFLGETPFQTHSPNPGALIPGAPAALPYDKPSGATLKLHGNLEMNISVLYNRDEREPAVSLDPQRRGDASLLMKYSLDYRLLPNLKVGLNAYLYRPDPADNLSLTGSFADHVMGMGPGLKYDLGRWSFLLKSQVETGREHGKDMQNWFRVWYAF
jgi:hypothetical protein